MQLKNKAKQPRLIDILQNALDQAIKENRIVSFACDATNAEIRNCFCTIDPSKQCEFYKATQSSDVVTVAPKAIYDKIFG